jgi:adenosylcobinamide amidohydrolase
MVTEIGTTEVGLVLDTVASTRTGGADLVRTAQADLGRPGGETTGTGTGGVAVIEGGQDPTAGHALLEGTEIGDMSETQTKRNSWVMMTLLKSLFALLLWKSKVGVTTTRLR